MPSLEYEHENVLKKVHVGNTDYYFKDEDLRNSVENFGTAVDKDAVETLDSSGTDLPTEAAVADYIDDFKTNEVDPKVSVALGNDEELIFNYIPVVSSSGTQYLVAFSLEDVQFGNRAIIQIQRAPDDMIVNAGDTLMPLETDHGSWQEYEDIPSPEFTVYDSNMNVLENHNFIFQGWCTDPNDRTQTIIDGSYIPDHTMTLYPVFSEVIAG